MPSLGKKSPAPERSLYLTALMGGVGSLLLILLGNWQLERHEWKQEILQRIQDAPIKEPLDILDINKHNIHQHEFKWVHVVGKWGNGCNFYVTGRTHNNHVGYHLFAIVQLANKMNMLVNFGWVCHKKFVARSPAPADFIGRIRVPDERNWFTPNNRPKLQEYTLVDIKEIEKNSGIPLLPYYVDYVREDTGVQPLPISNTVRIFNGHLGYAYTWFALAFFWTVGFIRVIWVSRRAF